MSSYLHTVLHEQISSHHAVFLSPQAEGIEKSYSQSVLLDLTENQAQIMQKTLNFSFPPDTVKGSERVQITAIGKSSVCHHALADVHVLIYFHLFIDILSYLVLVGRDCGRF